MLLRFPFTWALNETSGMKDNAAPYVCLCEVITAYQQPASMLTLLCGIQMSQTLPVCHRSTFSVERDEADLQEGPT